MFLHVYIATLMCCVVVIEIAAIVFVFAWVGVGVIGGYTTLVATKYVTESTKTGLIAQNSIKKSWF